MGTERLSGTCFRFIRGDPSPDGCRDQEDVSSLGSVTGERGFTFKTVPEPDGRPQRFPRIPLEVFLLRGMRERPVRLSSGVCSPWAGRPSLWNRF